MLNSYIFVIRKQNATRNCNVLFEFLYFGFLDPPNTHDQCKIQPEKDDGVVHGALLLGLVSGLVATRLPGIHIHIQELEVCPLYLFLPARQTFEAKFLKRTLHVTIP